MTTSVDSETHDNHRQTAIAGVFNRLIRFTLLRELLIILAFCAFTAALTWPYVTRLRDVVVDKGDPYLIAWILWWDYHQTFTDPLNLFHANTFYPLKYTLAFSEHSYGIAVFFFPLYALGLTPLTVHAVALFMGFAISGYGAFRLGRTLTGSTAVGWVVGIVFAFIPYRFNMMSQVAYVFSPWIPLVFEALVLFVRQRSKRRAAWLGFAFFMSGISTISWFTFTLIPFAVFAAVLLTRHGLWRERAFWRRSIVALVLAALALLPFMIPYALVARLYGFTRSIEEIKKFSAWPIHWLSVENRNKLWNGMGEGITESWNFKLFPGLLPIMFSLFSLVLPGRGTVNGNPSHEHSARILRLLSVLDVLALALVAISLLAIGFDKSEFFNGIFKVLTSERMLSLLTLAIIVRLCISYPSFLNPIRANLIETLRSNHRSDAFWLGVILSIIGFCFSLGWNFFFFRICYELFPMFRSMRVVSRGALLAYLGLAILSGLGVKLLSEKILIRYPRVSEKIVFGVACILLLFELNAAPLKIVRGEAYPDEITLKLKQTPMRGGIVHLPVGGDNNYRYMLRAADHQKPLVVGTSGFNSPMEYELEGKTHKGTIPDDVMTLIESAPTSYLVIANESITEERFPDYQAFLARALNDGRLRFINRYDGKNDLYVVVKTEPDVTSDALLPANLSIRDWATAINDHPPSLLSEPLALSQRLYRFHLASTGAMPRYQEFMSDLNRISRSVIVGQGTQKERLDSRFVEFAESWTKRETFINGLGQLNDAEYIDRLIENAAIEINLTTRNALVAQLSEGRDTRWGVLLKIVDDQGFVAKESNPSLVALHYFAYLRRNPDDPPDGNLQGFNFWVGDLERNRDSSKISNAFQKSGEYLRLKEKH